MSSPFRRGVVWVGIVSVALCAVVAAQQSAADRSAARSRIEARYEIVALRDGIGLRPKDRAARIQMIEVSDGAIAVDGAPVSGRELRDRVGADADLIIPLSYYDAAQRRAFLGQPEERPAASPESAGRSNAPRETPSADRPAEPAPEPPRAERPSPRRHRVGERVRVFGSVSVARDESVDGDVVAVLGSVRMDGHVSGQVVAVLGSVDLGPDAVVDGDVVAVGGRVRKADTAQVGGRITDVSMRGGDVDVQWGPWWAMPVAFFPFSGAARFFGTLFRLFVLGLLGSIVVLLVRQPIELVGQRVRSEPVKMAVIGLLAQLLFVPALVLTCIILAVTLIGIPLLIFVPFAIVALLFIMLGGFTATASVIGEWGAHRAGWNADQPYVRVWLGVVIVLTPLLVARFFGMVGGPFRLVAFMIAALALLSEYFVWTTGFGAALATAYERWRNRSSQQSPTVRPQSS